MKVTLCLIKLKVKAYLQALMAQNTKVIGKIIKDKVVEFFHGKMAKNMMEIGLIIKNRVTESFTFEMEAIIKVNSTQIKFMGKDFTFGINQNRMKASGSIIK